MEAQWIRDRAMLRTLVQKSPQWSNQEYAQAIGRKVELGQKMENPQLQVHPTHLSLRPEAPHRPPQRLPHLLRLSKTVVFRQWR